MACCHYYTPTENGADTFTVEMPRLTFGRGCLGEVGQRVLDRGVRRVALMTDPGLAGSEHLDRVRTSLRTAGVDFAEYDEVLIEPSDRSVLAAADFLGQSGADAVLAVGGGSVLDTAKGAMVYAAYPADFLTYFGKPIGGAQPVPGPLLPLIACPTTGGTGSEATGLSVIRIESLDTKFVIASRHILPVEAIVDPAVTDTLAPTIVASSGFDLLSHAIECYTARAYCAWEPIQQPAARPMVQGANPWSDLHAREALRIVGEDLERGVADAADTQARDRLMWAATLAGLAFGNCGTHLPHALSYGVSNLANDYRAPDYPAEGKPFVPHGISVIVTSPSAFRHTASGAPQRHLEAADYLGADTRDASPEDAGEVVAGRIIELMRATGMPNGLGDIGLGLKQAGALADSAIRQGRAIANAPRATGRDDVERVFAGAVSYW